MDVSRNMNKYEQKAEGLAVLECTNLHYLFLYVEFISCPPAHPGTGLSLGRGHYSALCFSSSGPS